MKLRHFLIIHLLFAVCVSSGNALLINDPAGDVENLLNSGFEARGYMDIQSVRIESSADAIVSTVTFLESHGADKVFDVRCRYTVDSIFAPNAIPISFDLLAWASDNVPGGWRGPSWAENTEQWEYGAPLIAASSVTWTDRSVRFSIGLEHGMAFSSDADKWILDPSTLVFEGVVVAGYDEDLSGDVIVNHVDFVEPPAPVPEPASLFLLGSGLGILAIWRKRRSPRS